MKRKGNVTISQCPDPFIEGTKSKIFFLASRVRLQSSFTE